MESYSLYKLRLLGLRVLWLTALLGLLLWNPITVNVAAVILIVGLIISLLLGIACLALAR